MAIKTPTTTNSIEILFSIFHWSPSPMTGIYRTRDEFEIILNTIQCIPEVQISMFKNYIAETF